MSCTNAIDIDERFRKEVREQKLPLSITLIGNPMFEQIARKLLAKHADHITISDDATTKVTLQSLEQFGTAFINAFMNEANPPKMPALLYSIPESALHSYAHKHNITIVEDTIDDTRKMLDAIAAAQPQSYYSLSKSARRLKNHAEILRKET